MKAQNQVVVQLRGGLGNQLFGLFAGLFLASNNNCALLLDGRLIKFGSNPDRKFELSKFDLTQIDTPIKIDNSFSLPENRWARRLFRFSTQRLIARIKADFPENVVTDLDNLSSYTVESDVLLDGYFSTYFYYEKWKEKNSDFILQPTKKSKAYLDCKRDLQNLTGLHLRLGDYLNHKDIYPIPTLQYYDQALKKVNDDNGFVVFCEDRNEAEKHFPSLIERAKMVITEKQFGAVETLCLMNSCRNLIVANSTFSHWAGVSVNLNGGKVICPSQFLHDVESTIAGTGWIKLDIQSGFDA